MIRMKISQHIKTQERQTRTVREQNAVEEICLNCTLPTCNGTCKRYPEEKKKIVKSHVLNG